MFNSTCFWDFRTPEEHKDVFFFEKDFNHKEVHKYMVQYFPTIVGLTVTYVLVIHLGQSYMKHRPALHLRSSLFVWNISLALYSSMAFVRLSGEVLSLYRNYGFQYSICDLHSVEHKNLMGFWLMTFALSKVMELGDTAFIVLRKTPLIFLHWYHHVVTLLYVWYSCVAINSLGRWFILANLFVHSIMYFYYALKVLRVKVSKAVSMAITSIQLVQMVVGIVITINAYLIKLKGEHCCVDYGTIFSAWAMYLSYFLLFLNFFVKSYLEKKPGPKNLPVMDVNGKKTE